MFLARKVRIVVLLASIIVAAVADLNAQRAATPQFRSITVVSIPSAKVWIDDIYYGKTDGGGRITIATVTPGAHTIRVRADGYKEKVQPLTAVHKGDISVELAKTTDQAELAFQEAERLTAVDRDQAAEAYRKAIRLRPALADAYIGLARVLTELGDYEEAEAAALAARRYKPGYPEASAVLARIYKESGEEEKAVTTFKRAITDGKGFQPEAYTGLGLLYKDRAEAAASSGDFRAEDSNYTEAAKNLKIALKQLAGAPDAVVIYQLLGLVYERQKSYKEAIALYEEFLSIFPDTAEATAVRSFIVQLRKQMNP